MIELETYYAQEIESAIKFILENTENPIPYCYSMPQEFVVPSVFFSSPEIVPSGDTLLTYSLNYSWVITFFHNDAKSAYALGLTALNALQRKRNIIPLINVNGELTGRGFHLKAPILKAPEEGGCGEVQLTLAWRSSHPYDNESAQKMMTYDTNIYIKNALDLMEYNETKESS
ncbi:MAG: hypothetical protein LBR74_00180 [Eubacterium sp.]|jgi:hypothetical protein|nr:hypothetical protein [Eubacterium sp.]